MSDETRKAAVLATGLSTQGVDALTAHVLNEVRVVNEPALVSSLRRDVHDTIGRLATAERERDEATDRVVKLTDVLNKIEQIVDHLQGPGAQIRLEVLVKKLADTALERTQERDRAREECEQFVQESETQLVELRGQLTTAERERDEAMEALTEPRCHESDTGWCPACGNYITHTSDTRVCPPDCIGARARRERRTIEGMSEERSDAKPAPPPTSVEGRHSRGDITPKKAKE